MNPESHKFNGGSMEFIRDFVRFWVALFRNALFIFKWFLWN